MKQKLLHLYYSFLRILTKNYIRRIRPIVIGVTGSVGKTGARMVISQVLEQVQDTTNPQKVVYTSPQNFNSELGLILSIFQIESYTPSTKDLLKKTGEILKKSLFGKKPYDIFVAEYGIDTPGDMDTLLSTLWPDIVVLTKLDSVHEENFPNGKQGLWTEKWKLPLAARKKVYFNAQDTFSKEHVDLLDVPSEQIFKTEVPATYEKTDAGIQQTTNYEGKDISLNLIGQENAEYVRMALCIAQDLGIPLMEESYDFVFTTIPGRQTIFERGNTLFLDSSYNSSPMSMQTMIRNITTLRDMVSPDAKLVGVFGDMRELGDASQKLHQAFSKNLFGFDALFFVGPMMYQYVLPELQQNGYTGEIHASLSSREIGKKLKKYLSENSDDAHAVLVKGGQNTIFTEEALAPQLTPTQQKNLTRQSDYWKKTKDEFFKTL